MTPENGPYSFGTFEKRPPGESLQLHVDTIASVNSELN